jgi:SAM-dependent methyltransferase
MAKTNIKSFWAGRAADPSLDSAQVTHPDIWQCWLEIETIKRLLWPEAHVIDIGCGAGYATKRLAPLVEEILGVEYSEGMIRRAIEEEDSVPPNASFAVADVLNLSLDELGTFDVALPIRCLIDLPDWETQQRAPANIASIVKSGGLYVFIEGLSDGRASLDILVWHNLDFDGARTLGFLERWFKLEREMGFGTYDLGARVVHPLLLAPDQPKYDARINEIAARVPLERPGDKENSRVAVYCLRRR